MENNKTASEYFQLFSGIHEKKLFLQIVDRRGNPKYEFESNILDDTTDETLCKGIMEACYDFFDPKKFRFDGEFVLGRTYPYIVRSYGFKALFEEKKVIACRSFDGLQPMSSFLFMETFLPFEEHQVTHTVVNRPWENPANNRGAWFSSNDTWHGIAE